MSSPVRARLDSGLDAARRGYRVFELRPAGKIPRAAGWQAAATLDAAEITRRWTARPDSNIGIALAPGQYVLDVDGPSAMAAVQAMGLPPTLTIRSGRPEGGTHLYFAVPGDLRLANLTRVCDVPALEGKTKGKLVAWAGSLHSSGAVYTIERDVPAAPLPAWLAERIGERREINADALNDDELRAIADLVARRSPPAAAAMRREAVECFTQTHRALDAALPAIAAGWGDEFFRQAAKVGRHVGVGVLGWGELVEALEHVARCHGVTVADGGHVFRSIRRGVAAGAREVCS